jgi:hypothetical protein
MKKVSILAIAVFALIAGVKTNGHEKVGHHDISGPTYGEARFARVAERGDQAEFRIRNSDREERFRSKEEERGFDKRNLRASRAIEEARTNDRLSSARDWDDRRVEWGNREREPLAIRSREEGRPSVYRMTRA